MAADIVGGVLVPAIAGGLSDAIDESAFLWVSMILAVMAFIFATRLEKTPKIV